MTSHVVSATQAADDLQIIHDDARPAILDDVQRENDKDLRRYLRWLIPVTPWAWFVIRGFHPILEIVAILLPVLVVVAIAVSVLLAAFFRSWLAIAIAGSLGLFLLAAVALPRSPISSAEPLSPTRFAAINVAERWFSYNDVGWFVAQQEPDVFVGLELSEAHDNDLQGRFENSITDLTGFPPQPAPVGTTPTTDGTYRENDGPGIGLYSNFPLTLLEDPLAEEVPGGLPGFRAILALPEGDVVLYALHIPRPGTGSGIYEVGPFEQRNLVNAIAASIEEEDIPVVIMGDLNVVDRGAAYRHLTDNLWDVMRIDGWASPTREGDIWHTALQLRIDHLLISSELCAMDARATQVFFTDHRPIQADLGLCPQG